MTLSPMCFTDYLSPVFTEIAANAGIIHYQSDSSSSKENADNQFKQVAFRAGIDVYHHSFSCLGIKYYLY